MSSFRRRRRRRRRRLPPPQERVRIRRGCNKSHLLLFSARLSLSSRAENTKKAVFMCVCVCVCVYTPSRVRVFVGCRVHSFISLYSMRLPPKKPPKIGLFCTFASQKKVKKEERGSNNQNLPRTPHNSFPFPLRGYIYIREEREGRSSFRIYAVNPLFSRERVV